MLIFSIINIIYFISFILKVKNMPNFSKENEKIKQKIENEKQLTKSMVIYIGKYL